MSCAEIRLSLGAYVLGTLPSEQTGSVRAHLSECPDCAAEHEELAGLPNLLAMVSGPDVGVGSRAGRHAAAGQPSDTPLLDRLLARAAREEGARRRRSRLVAVASAAAAVLVVLAGVALFRPASDTQQPGSGVVAGQPVTLTASDSATGVRAQLAVTPKGWGTSLSISLQGVSPGLTCRLEAVGDDSREVASTWQVPVEGYSAASGSLTIPGAIGMHAGQVKRYEVITSTGDRLVAIPVT